MSKTTRVVLACLVVVVALARFCQIDILWVEEAYPTAAAAELLRGKFLYRDIWFDKPPLYALVYLLWHAQTGWALRGAGVLFVLLACGLAYRFALEMWSEQEAMFAALLLAIALTFGIPSAVMALAPDLLMVVPHIAAIWLAWRGRAFWSGVLAGVAFLVNAKALFVAAACLVWVWRGAIPFAIGFALPNAIFIAVLAANGAWEAYVLQVWTWGRLYSADTFGAHPFTVGVQRTLNWAGFQSTALLGAA